MKIQLDLTKHCIETELKRRHNRLVSRYFKLKRKDLDLENKIDCIGKALNSLNFQFLRSHFSDLAGNSDKDILLSVDEKGEIHILIEGNEIDLQASS